MTGNLVPFPSLDREISPEAARALAERFLSMDVDRWKEHAAEFRLDQPETLLSLCQLIDSRLDSEPSPMAIASVYLYERLESYGPEEGGFLFDEREYYLGELARLAGTAFRVLHRQDDALTWLERAQAWFLMTANSTGDIARVQYQRLAVYMEQRRLEEVLTLSRPLREGLWRAGLKEVALKCEYAGAMALRELGRSAEALIVFERVYSQACEIRSTKIIGPCLVMLVQVHSDLGNAEQAVRFVEQAVPVLTDANNRVALAKLYSGIGLLFRSQRRNEEAIRAFRTSQEQLGALELRAEVAALNLLIADILLEGGQERQAEWEIRAALPVIDELKMVPEGFAAMSLLRESLRRRSIDRQALRKLHGYFEESGS